MNEREKRQMAVSTLRRAGREQEAAELEQQGKRGNKYGAVKTEYNGRRYDSKAEAEYAAGLDHAWKYGRDILGWLPQIPFTLPGGTIYRADFLVLYGDEGVEAIDVKGVNTAAWRVKWREVKAAYPWVTFRVARRGKVGWQVSDD